MSEMPPPNSGSFFSKVGQFSAILEDLSLICGLAMFHDQFNVLGKFDEKNLRSISVPVPPLA